MEAKIETRGGFNVLGVQVRCRPETADWEAIWMKQFMPHHDRLSPLSTDKAYYGLCFETDVEGTIDYLAGMAVAGAPTATEGLTLRQVPAGRYAAFECTVATIGETWQGIFGGWLPTSEYEYDPPRPSLEFYPPDTAAKDSPVTIYVPVKAKTAE